MRGYFGLYHPKEQGLKPFYSLGGEHSVSLTGGLHVSCRLSLEGNSVLSGMKASGLISGISETLGAGGRGGEGGGGGGTETTE